MKTFKVDREIKLEKFLKQVYGEKLPYSSYKKLLRNKDIKVNGKRINSEITLNLGDVVEVYFDGVNKSLKVLYVDENVLVLDKPCGIEVEDFELLVQKTYNKAKMVHRLDRNTSGIMVFSLNDKAYEELLFAFKNRDIDKYYLAEVYGFFDNDEGVLTDYLVKDSKKSKVEIFKNSEPNSVKIITEYKTIEKLEKSSIIEVKLITGKTHQIRAHTAFYGHFIIGDGKYGDNLINKSFSAKYQRLTASRIEFKLNGKLLSYLNGKQIKIERNPW